MGLILGVAAIMLYFGGTLGQFTDWPISGYMAVILAAFVGACVILGLIIYFSAKVKNNVMLLIIGIMIGYLASSVISILNYYSSTDRVHAFVMWDWAISRGILGTIAFLRDLRIDRVAVGCLADKASECPAAGNTLCRKPGNQHPPYT